MNTGVDGWVVKHQNNMSSKSDRHKTDSFCPNADALGLQIGK